MVWKLISYSEIKMPLAPYKSNYVVGVAEDENGQRCVVQISKEHTKELAIGMSGNVKIAEGPAGEINIFEPDLERKTVKPTKVALVTGSSGGIGRAIALEFAKNGVDVVVNDLEVEAGEKVVEEIKKMGRRSLYVQADVSDSAQVEQMAQKVVQEFGRIDILVNNAGITCDKLFANMDIEHWNKVIAVNLTGVFNCTKSVIKHMQKQGEGKIINMSSVIGEVGNIGQANYAASKGGIIPFTKTIAKEYAGEGITANAIAPGFIKTRMAEAIPKGVMRKIMGQIPLGRLGKPEEVAKLAWFLASEDSNYITGHVFHIDGGLYM